MRAISIAGSLVLTVAMVTSMAGCGGGGGGSSQTSSPSLWVSNRSSSTIVSFSAAVRKQSGTPAASLTNSSLSLLEPEGVIFDKQGNMWVANCSGSDNFAGSLLEFTKGQLGQLKKNPAQLPNMELLDDGGNDIFDCPYGLEFDESGNLWVTNRFGGNLIAFTPNQLQQSGAQLPDTNITYTNFGDPEDLVFDKSGTLWIADASAGAVYGYKKATLAIAMGTVVDLTPDFINQSAALNQPDALAFDREGNLWVSNCAGNTLLRFSATDINGNGAPTPEITIEATTVTTTPPSTADSLHCPEGITFDSKGNLWVSNGISDTFGSLAEFTPSQLAASGSPAPAVFIDADSKGVSLNQPVLIDFGTP